MCGLKTSEFMLVAVAMIAVTVMAITHTLDTLSGSLITGLATVYLTGRTVVKVKNGNS